MRYKPCGLKLPAIVIGLRDRVSSRSSMSRQKWRVEAVAGDDIVAHRDHGAEEPETKLTRGPE